MIMNIIWRQHFVYIICRRCLSSANLYDRLGISPTATQAEIKEAYIKLSKLYHPDARTAQSSAEKFAEINAAYETLGRSDRRRLYDSERLWRSAASSAAASASSAAYSSPGDGRRSAGPTEFDQRMRHEMEWMYRAASSHQRQRQHYDVDSDWDVNLRKFKVSVVIALVVVIIVGVGVRLFVMSIIQSSQLRRDESDYQLAMSILLQQQQQPDDATKRSEISALKRDRLLAQRAERTGSQIQQRSGQQKPQRSPSSSGDASSGSDIDPDYLAQTGGGFRGARPVSPSHARSMRDRRLRQFRQSASTWSAETRAALRPRLSPELAEELDRLQAAEDRAKLAQAAAPSG